MDPHAASMFISTLTECSGVSLMDSSATLSMSHNPVSNNLMIFVNVGLFSGDRHIIMQLPI